jgi:hypothetical protein
MGKDLASYYARQYLDQNKGMSLADQMSAYKKLSGGDFNADSYASSLKGGFGVGGVGYGVGAAAKEYKSLFKPAVTRFGNTQGVPQLKQDTGRGFWKTNNAQRAEELRNQMFGDAYKDSIMNNLYSEYRVTDPEQLKKLGDAGISGIDMKSQNYWDTIHNNLTGEDMYVKNTDAHRYAGGLKGSLDRNKAAYAAGAGALLGFVTGGPIGAVLGGVGGYAAGKRSQDQSDEAFQAQKDAMDQYNEQQRNDESLVEQLRKRRVRRSAGEASAEYDTDKPTVGTDAQTVSA